MKKIHIINPYGTLPSEGWRKYRTNIIAEYFSEHNWDVSYWISNIDHRSKKNRAEKDEDVVINSNFRFKIIYSPPYSGNGSINRIKYEIGFSKRVKEIFFREEYAADVILITDPALFYGHSIYKIVEKTKSKFFIDILDLWPEVFITLFPKKLLWTSSIVLSPFYYLRKKLFKKADGFIAVTKDYLEIAKKNCEDIPGEVVYIGLDLAASKNIQSIDIQKVNNEKWIVYAGTLGINYDIKTILEFANKLEQSNENAKLIIAGDGPLKNLVEETISVNKLKKTIFVGRLNVEELNYVYSKCDIALSTYLADSTVSMPVKAFDYMAFGLPVINSLNREYGKIVQESKIGLQYEAENVNSLFCEFSKLMVDSELLSLMNRNNIELSKEFEISNQYRKYFDFVEKSC
ncbi:glycosyltransferase family 4 protein [Flavobacterium sp. Arc3]|uniref:glycosyltransferase family 4 protein n=1 Tax=Flavobacterium sp. Arc3 TaxID=3046686 RepID=UPI00352DA5F5